jgi:hypothetical protein
MKHDRAISKSVDCRTVFDDRKHKPRMNEQMDLFPSS